MKFDFTKPTPQAKTLKKAQKIINVLWDRLFESQNESQKKELALISEIADLKEKLNTNSSNSSKAPSSDLFKTKKPKKKYHGAGKSNTLKQGAQKGHEGKGRKLLPPEEVDNK